MKPVMFRYLLRTTWPKRWSSTLLSRVQTPCTTLKLLLEEDNNHLLIYFCISGLNLRVIGYLLRYTSLSLTY